MALIDTVVSHYSGKGRLIIEVPEWQGEDLPDGKVYYTPFTLAERNKLIPLLKKESLDFVVGCIVMKAEDADGNKLFGIEDKPKLKRFCEYAILDRVANQMLNGVTEADVGE